MLTKILLGLGALSNVATLVGLWIAYISAPVAVQSRIASALLLVGAACSVVVYLLIAFFLLWRAPHGSAAAHSALNAAEQRIANLERRLDERLASEESALPVLRPKIIPIRWGRTPDNRFGLFVRNHGEPAFDIFVEEPVPLGTAKLKFWDRIYPALTKDDGELFIDSYIQLSRGVSLTASALRDQMIKADLDAITMKINYRDLDQGWATVFDVVREFWGDGLRVSAVRQEKT